jgi:NarL family two-component system response regulator LiaR
VPVAAPTGPLRIAILDDYQIVVSGIAAMLEPFADRVAVVELDAGAPPLSDIDILLYDTFAQAQGSDIDVGRLTAGQEARVVIFSWNVDHEVVESALRAGASGYLSKGMPAEEMVAALERVHAGETVAPPNGTEASSDVGDWPGREVGLSARESEVIALITQGFTNQEMAERAYLSINSIKTYIRLAYRKIDVTRRSQAVAWGMRNGFEPDLSRKPTDPDSRWDRP